MYWSPFLHKLPVQVELHQKSASLHRHAVLLSLGRIYGEQRATYESASLRMFQLGRTDTIRSASVESSVFVRAMDSPQEQVLGPLKCHIPFANKAFWGKEVSNNLNCTLEFMSWTIMSTQYKVG